MAHFERKKMSKHASGNNNKKIVIAIIVIVIIASIGICLYLVNQNNNRSNISSSTEVLQNKSKTAEEIISKMKEKNTNIGKVVIYNSETDLNKLLGRPGQYTSKITFEDKRIKQTNANLDKELSTEAEINEPTGGTIEVFENEKDMKNRKNYVEGFSTTAMFSQYIYSKGNALLRIDGDLTPEQAREYETLFNEIVK